MGAWLNLMHNMSARIVDIPIRVSWVAAQIAEIGILSLKNRLKKAACHQQDPSLDLMQHLCRG
jgi:hypothetical protein